MLFLVALQNFVVLHTRSALKALHTVDDDQIAINFEDENDGQDTGLYFALDAEITVDAEDPSSFTVKDIEGDDIEFNAYTPARLPRDQDLTQKGIYKGTATFAFLFDSGINSVDEVYAMPLASILAECTDGHMMGQMSVDITIERIPNERVAAEEIAMAGDGTFFADPDELADAED